MLLLRVSCLLVMNIDQQQLIRCFRTQVTIIWASDCPPLCHCYTESTHCDDKGLINIPRGISPTTAQLFLRKNNISDLGSDAFAFLTSLTLLDLAKNSISALPSDVFRSLTLLDSLNLNSNKISYFRCDVFESLTSLKFLYLRHNKITNLSTDFFKSLTSLRTLDLSNNKLVTLPSNGLLSLTSLAVLDLRENPLECDCNLAAISEMMRAKESFFLGQCNDSRTGKKVLLNHLKTTGINI